MPGLGGNARLPIARRSLLKLGFKVDQARPWASRAWNARPQQQGSPSSDVTHVHASLYPSQFPGWRSTSMLCISLLQAQLPWVLDIVHFALEMGENLVESLLRVHCQKKSCMHLLLVGSWALCLCPLSLSLPLSPSVGWSSQNASEHVKTMRTVTVNGWQNHPQLWLHCWAHNITSTYPSIRTKSRKYSRA